MSVCKSDADNKFEWNFLSLVYSWENIHSQVPTQFPFFFYLKLFFFWFVAISYFSINTETSEKVYSIHAQLAELVGNTQFLEPQNYITERKECTIVKENVT